MADPTRTLPAIIAAIAANISSPIESPNYPAFTPAELARYFNWDDDPMQAAINTLLTNGVDVSRGGAFSNSLQDITKSLAAQSTAMNQWQARDTSELQTGQQLQDALNIGMKQHQTSFMGNPTNLNAFLGNVGNYLKNSSGNEEPGREALASQLTQGSGADTNAFTWLNDMLRGTVSPMLLRSRNMPGLYDRLHNRWNQEGSGSFAEYLLGLFGSGGAS